MVMLILLLLIGKLLLGKHGQKTQNCQFKLKCGTEANSNIQKSKVGLYVIIMSRTRFRVNLDSIVA